MIKLVFVGDVMLGRTFNSHDRYPFDDKILQTFEQADLVIGNLECAITPFSIENMWPDKAFNFQLDPRHKNWLQSFSYLSIANNHILDFGIKGMNDTKLHLNSLGIKYGGAGDSVGEAQKPSIINVKGQTFAVFSMADHYDYWAATESSPGIWFVNLSSDAPTTIIERYHSSNPDHFIIVSIHWGPNYESFVSQEKRNFASKLINAGVKIIHGHSAHHIQPVEMIRDSLVIFSNGDFIDDYAIDPVYRNDIGMIVNVTIDRGITHVSTNLTLIKNMKVFETEGNFRIK